MILVTGATGHIGNVLVRQLVHSAEKVRVLILPGEDDLSLASLNVEKMTGDILVQSTLDKAMKGVGTVYHLAGLVSIQQDQQELLQKINVDGTQNVIDAARQAGVQRLIYTSSIHALARPPIGITIDEKQAFDINNAAGDYDRSKAMASLKILEAVSQGLDAVIVCPTGVIGPYDFRRSEIGELILGWMKKKISILIDGKFDFVDVRDVARGHILAKKFGRKGEVYILGGEQLSLENLRNIVKDYLEVRSPLIKIPYRSALWLTNLSERYYRWTKTRPRFTRYSLETVVSNSTITYNKAREELGYSPRSLVETVTDTVKWWLDYRGKIQPTLRV
jgi:dihydroflavonol-4-reductase